MTPDEERDAALIDRLYGDPPGGDDDLGELRTVRALIARVREEAPVAEPSPAIAATLLAAARERAPKEGLWARFVAWMSPVTSHPGLAAAATLVVVVGATALWMRDGGKAAEPKYETSDTRRAEEPKKEEALPADEYETAGTVATPTEAEPGAKADVPKADPEPPAKPVRRAPPAKKAEPTQDRALADKGEGTKEEKPKVVVTGRVDGQVGGGAASGGDADKADKKKAPQNDVAPTTSAPPPPPPSPEPVMDDEGGDSDGAGSEETVTVNERDSSSVDRARAVTKKARAEAEKNNCKNTTAYGSEVRNLDRGTYDRDFVKDRAIDACLRRGRSKSQTQSGQ